jgi:capsular exopolysaccharide synthesis family protein
LDPLLCTYHQPLSVEAEAFRGVRAALLFNHGRQQRQVIQIASPVVGDGKSTLAANLAISIAQSGKEVLLVDGDLRHPRVHDLFGQTADPGLAAVICDGTELHDAVRSTQIGGLSLLPAGCVAVNPADIFASSRIGELIPVLRERYDFVLIDTAPLLAVTEAQAIAASVDGVILAIRPSKTEISGAQRALDILQMVGANLLGIVVNGTSGCEYDNYGERYHSNSRQQDRTLVSFDAKTPSTTEKTVSAAGNSHVQQN